MILIKIYISTLLDRFLSDVLLLFTAGLFDENEKMQEIAFDFAIEQINKRTDLLPRTRLEAIVTRIPEYDSFQASKKGELNK